MTYKKYLPTFQKAGNAIDTVAIRQKQMEVAVGEVLDCVFLKLYKKSWTSDPGDPLTAESRIFFSIWISDTTIQQQKLFYNIHALKLRKLPGYHVESRKFADAFRTAFQQHVGNWKNVSTDFGPLTLMEGWINFDEKTLRSDIEKLGTQFLKIAPLIDKTLLQYL